VLPTNMRAVFCPVASAKIARTTKIVTTKEVFVLMASAKITTPTAKELKTYARTTLNVSQTSAVHLKRATNWVPVQTKARNVPKVKIVALLSERIFLLYPVLYYYSLAQTSPFAFFISLFS